jgi:hypothetical protein
LALDRSFFDANKRVIVVHENNAVGFLMENPRPYLAAVRTMLTARSFAPVASSV